MRCHFTDERGFRCWRGGRWGWLKGIGQRLLVSGTVMHRGLTRVKLFRHVDLVRLIASQAWQRGSHSDASLAADAEDRRGPYAGLCSKAEGLMCYLASVRCGRESAWGRRVCIRGGMDARHIGIPSVLFIDMRRSLLHLFVLMLLLGGTDTLYLVL